MPDSGIEEKIGKIKKAVWAKRPIFGEILDKHGNKTLFDYSKEYIDVNPTPGLDHRKEELYKIVHELLASRLGEAVADDVQKQLEKKPLVSTADHHGIIDNPFWINSNILQALPITQSGEAALRYNIVFSFASVSVNNASAYPRGIIFHGDGAGEQTLRLPILPDKEKMAVVYTVRGFTADDVSKAKKQLAEKVKRGEVTDARAQDITMVIDRFINVEDVLKLPTLAEQVTVINYRLWPHLFHRAAAESASVERAPVVDLIYVEIESILRELLIRHHLRNRESLIHRLLFATEDRPLIEKHFNNLAGSFSLEEKWGTYFFWTMDEKMHRVGLFLQGKELVSADGAYRIPYTPESIAEGLQSKRLFPSMFLCYVMIPFYYGMKCLGGFSQVHDLSMIKNAWQAYLREIGSDAEAEAVAPVQTKEMTAGGIVLAFEETANHALVAATGIDLAVSKKDTSFERFIELSKKVTLIEMMNAMLPETYTVFFSERDRDPALASLSSAEILKATGVEAKLRSYLAS